MKHAYLKSIFSKPLPLVLVALFCITLSSIVVGNNAHASVWNVNDGYGGYRTGYFSGNYARYNLNGGSGYVLQEGIPWHVGDNGDPENPYPEINEFIRYIWGKYDRYGSNGSEWRDRVGASFIIHSMIGKQQPQGSIDVSDEEYNQWVTSLNQPGMSVTWSQYGSTNNDTYMNTDTDVARANFGDEGQILTFRLNGNIVYRLNRACANPDGDLPGLPKYNPPPQWSITPSSEVTSISGTSSKTVAKIGTTVTWQHTVRNNGPDTTDAVVYGHYQNRTGATGAGPWSDTGVSEQGLGGSIKSIKSARCLDVNASNMQYVQQWDCNGTGQQLWRYDASAHTLKLARDTSRCLNSTGSGNNSPVNLIPCNGRAEQKWVFNANGLLRNEGSNNCLDASSGNNGLQAIVYTCRTAANMSENTYSQIWINGTEGEDYSYGGFPATHTRQFNSTYKVTLEDVGRTLCRSTSMRPGAWNSTGWTESSAACVRVPFEFNLTPAMSSLSGIVEPGAVLPDLTPTIDNKGPTRTEGAVEWQISRIIVSKTGTITTSLQENNRSPCLTYGNTCTPERTGTQEFSVGLTNLAVLAGQLVPNDAEVGSQVCVALSVKPYKDGTTDWRHGIPVCVVVGKLPKVQVLGGDLVVGRETASNPKKDSNVGTSFSYSPITGRTYGSWSEYAIIPSGTVTGMASGALYAEGSSSSNLCDLSLLTLSNATAVGSSYSCTAGSVGKYDRSTAAPDVAKRFPVPSPTPATQRLTTDSSKPSIDVSVLAGSLVYTSAQSNIDINSSSDFGAGHWVVINAQDTTVTIKSNIQYTSSALTSINSIPQVVIIAKNISIDPGVTRVDAWLIATGTSTTADPTAGYINTCSTVVPGNPTAATVNATQCTNRLTVNGPVQANKLYMYRTAGAGRGAAAGDPAEVFNLRADAYIWASVYSPGNGRIPTVSSKELPPRY